jgi:hypothetical protein
MKRFKRSNKKGPVRAKKASMDGIQFRSGLEKNTYIALKEAGLFELYEVEVFQLIEGFTLPNICIEKQANGKGELIDRGQKKVLGIKYTPDFTGYDYICECKGRANEAFPLRWKLFKRWCVKNKDTRPLYKPQNQKDIAIMIKLILDGRKQ